MTQQVMLSADVVKNDDNGGWDVVADFGEGRGLLLGHFEFIPDAVAMAEKINASDVTIRAEVGP